MHFVQEAEDIFWMCLVICECQIATPGFLTTVCLTGGFSRKVQGASNGGKQHRGLSIRDYHYVALEATHLALNIHMFWSEGFICQTWTKQTWSDWLNPPQTQNRPQVWKFKGTCEDVQTDWPSHHSSTWSLSCLTFFLFRNAGEHGIHFIKGWAAEQSLCPQHLHEAAKACHNSRLSVQILAQISTILNARKDWSPENDFSTTIEIYSTMK